MSKRIFELHLGVDQNEVTGGMDYVVSGSVAKGAEDTFIGGCLLGIVKALDKESRTMTAKTIDYVNDGNTAIPVSEITDKALEEKWVKKK